MKSILTIIPLRLTCFTHTCQLCTPTIIEVYGVCWYGCCYLLIFVAKKATKGSELQFLCTQGTLQGGRVTEHRMMFARQFHQLQSCS